MSSVGTVILTQMIFINKDFVTSSNKFLKGLDRVTHARKCPPFLKITNVDYLNNDSYYNKNSIIKNITNVE